MSLIDFAAGYEQAEGREWHNLSTFLLLKAC